MSCDYQRWEYWRQFRHSYQGQVPEPIRDLLEDVLKDALQDLLEDMIMPDSTRRSLEKRRQTDPMEYAIEVTYRRGKQAARSREERWTQEERQLLAQKTHKLLRRIRTTGVPDGVDPVHSKTGLPRISSQAGYAAVYDQLMDLGINLDSPFDSICEAIEYKTKLSSEERRELIRRVEKIEAQLRKGANADEAVIVSDILAIQAAVPDIFNLLIEVLADPRAGFGEVAERVIGQVQAEVV